MRKFFKDHAEDIEHALLIILFGGLLQLAFSIRAYGSELPAVSKAASDFVTLSCLTISKDAKVSQQACETFYTSCIQKLISSPKAVEIIQKGNKDVEPSEFLAIQFYNNRESRSLCQ